MWLLDYGESFVGITYWTRYSASCVDFISTASWFAYNRQVLFQINLVFLTAQGFWLFALTFQGKFNRFAL